MRRVIRLFMRLVAMAFIGGAFALRAAPDYLPPDKMQALHDAFPFLYHARLSAGGLARPGEATGEPAETGPRDFTRRPPPPDPSERAPSTFASRPSPFPSSEHRLPVAERKVLRVSE